MTTPTLITNKHNKDSIINLDNVANVERTEYKGGTGPDGKIPPSFHIHFTYPAICVDEQLYSIWSFESKKDCDETFGRLISVFNAVSL